MKSSEKAHDCYNCSYKGTIRGSAHSSCYAIQKHTLFSVLDGSLKTQLELVCLKEGKLPFITKRGEPLLEMERQGVTMGWCNWPFDFDPTWIKECKLFSPVKTEKVFFEKIDDEISI